MRAVTVRKTSSWAAPAAVAPYRAAASGQGHRACWPFNHDRTHRSTGTCGPSQSGRLQAGRPPLLLYSHGTGPRPGSGQGHRACGPFNHDRTHRSTGTCGPSQPGRLQAGRPPLLLHSHGTGPRPGTGQGHRAGGPFKLYSPRSRSLAGSDSVTEALARTGRLSQKEFKLGGPHCSGCCTVQDRHRTGPSGRRAIIQSAVTVPGGIMIRLTEALKPWRARAVPG